MEDSLKNYDACLYLILIPTFLVELHLDVVLKVGDKKTRKKTIYRSLSYVNVKLNYQKGRYTLVDC